MTPRSPSFPAAFVAVFLLAGCVSRGPFPSLALREEEREASAAPTPSEPPAIASDAALVRRIGELAQQAFSGERSFREALPVVEASVAAGGAAGSESWVEAQEAISRLESARTETTRALADLHQLALERADQPTNTDDARMLSGLVSAVDDMAAGQQARIDGLRAAISRR